MADALVFDIFIKIEINYNTYISNIGDIARIMNKPGAKHIDVTGSHRTGKATFYFSSKDGRHLAQEFKLRYA